MKLKDLAIVKEFVSGTGREQMHIILLIIKVDLDKRELCSIGDDMYCEIEAIARRAWDCDPVHFLDYPSGWGSMAPFGIVDELYDWLKDVVVFGRWLPGKRLVPSEELWDDTSDKENMD